MYTQLSQPHFQPQLSILKKKTNPYSKEKMGLCMKTLVDAVKILIILMAYISNSNHGLVIARPAPSYHNVNKVYSVQAHTPVPPAGPNPCTNIPRGGPGHCKRS